VAAWFGFAPSVLAQAPPNDSFASATQLLGPSGTMPGSNIGATQEAGEPSTTGNAGGKSVWYSWTAPADMAVTFDTFGSDFDTLLGIYSGASVNALTTIAENDNFGNILQSSATFTATSNTTYYIKVDGFNAGAGYGASQGSIVLHWGNSISVGVQAGDFRFTSAYYLTSDLDNFSPQDPRGAMQFAPTHLTITRERGSAGKVQVSYSVDAGSYTNFFFTFLFGTNIYSTNIVWDTNLNVIVPSQTTFTNILSTNWMTFSFFQDMQYGQFQFLEEIDETNFTITNNNGVLFPPTGVTIITNDLPTDTTQPPNCGLFPPSFLTVTPLQITLPNTNWVATNYTYTEIYCTTVDPFPNIVVVSSAPGFQSITGTTNFDDYQMSADVIVDPLPLEFQEGSIAQPFLPPGGFWINPYVLGTITGVALDPLESQTIGAPTASTPLTNAYLNVLNNAIQGFLLGTATLNTTSENAPHTADTGRLATNVFNLERATIRCTRNVNGFHTAVVYVLRDSLNYQSGTEVNYRIDHLKGPPTDNGNNIFPQFADEIPLQAGSDYATPPGPSEYGTDPDFESVTGTLTWGANDNTLKPIIINITNYNKVEFNEDLLIELYFPGTQPTSPTDKCLGVVHFCVLTILFDNERGDAQPAGAVDRMHNMDNDPSTVPHPYNLHPGANSTVFALAIQPDGKSVIGGDFTAFNTEVRNRIARMNINGLMDTTFNPPGGADQFVSSLLADPSGKIVAGGAFNSMNGVNRKGIARLNSDGSLDTSFFPGAGAGDIVWALAFHTNNSILVAGQFQFFNNLPRSYIARVSGTGVLDPLFTPSVDGTIHAMAVQGDGKIIIAGEFLNVNGVSRIRIARLNPDGSLDTSFDPGYGIDNTVYALTLQADGKILAGGSFQYAGAQNRNSIVRLNTNGTVDQTFDPGDGADDTIYSISVQPDGGIIACGIFSSFNQTRRNTMVRLFADGTVDTSFMDTAYNQFAGLPTHYWDPNAESRNFIFSSALQADGNLMVGGGFHRVGGGWSRTDVRFRENVARIIGGSTPGPGNISFAYDSFSADQFSDQVFIQLNRENGSLGIGSATVGPTTSAPGPGVAVDGEDFTFSSIYANPTYLSSWPLPTWQIQDGTFGPNNTNTLTIAPNTPVNYPQNKVFISILDNTNQSGNRSFNMKLSHPTGTDIFHLGFGPLDSFGYYAGENIPLGFALGKANAPFNILDYHVLPGVLGFSSPTYTIGEGGTNAIVTITRTNGIAGLVSIHFATANGTATNGIHYIATNGILTFLPGVTNQSFSIRIIDENIVEHDHTVLLNLFAPAGGATAGLTNAVLTIVDNDVTGGYVQFNSPLMGTNVNGPYAIYGTNENAVYAAVTVSRNGSGSGLLTAQLTATNGTALSGLNFTGFTNTLTWVSGDVQPKVIPVRLFDDGIVQTNAMSINLTLSAATLNGFTNSAGLGSPTFGILYVTNSDFSGTLGFSAPVYAVNENGGPAIVTVVRSGGSAGSATINFATLPGTSTPGVDFISTNGTLHFGPGEVSKSFAVQIIDNNSVNPPRFIALSLSAASPPGVLGNPSTAILNIIDDESFSEPPGGLDPTVNPSVGFNDAVHALVQQPDGKFMAGGDFTLADGLSRQRIARLNSDFSLDSAFSSVLPNYGANASVLGLVCQTDLRILVCGLFTNFNGVAQNYITRLNADGTLDSTFNIGSAADNPVYAIAETFVGPDRKLLLAGSFLHVNGLSANYLTRLNNNGSPDGNFNAGSGPNGTIFAMALQPDGKIIIGGDFTIFNGTSRTRVARLNANGSLDLSFDPGAGANDSVRSIAVQPDGRVLLGGVFTNVNGVILNHLARLNADGSVDNSFTPGLAANDLVSSITLQPDTRIILGGQFTLFNSVTRHRITRLNNDGTIDSMINFGYGADSYVAATLFQTNAHTGMIVFAGAFASYDAHPAYRIARVFAGSISGAGALEFDNSFYEVAEDGTNTVVNIRRRNGTTGIVSVDFNTADNSGIAGINYLPVMTNLVFPSGEVLRTVTIPVLRDFAISSNLWVDLNLSNYQPPPPNGPTVGNIPSAELIIDNVDTGVAFSAPTYSFTETDPSGFALISVVRSGSTNGAASVDFYTLTNGTAVPFVNFIPVTNTLSFVPGQVSNFVTVPLIHDPAATGDRTVPLLLSNANNTLLLTPSRSTLTIVDVDRFPGQFTFSQTNYFVNEGAGLAILTLNRTNGHTGAVTVQYQTMDGTAHAGFNYVATNGTVAFADGEIGKNIAVPIIQTAQVTGNTAFSVGLFNPTGGSTILGSTNSTVTILDNHVGIAFTSPIFIGTETDGSITLGVNRIGTNGSTSFIYATTNGTALAGTNYQATTGSLTFVPGETFKTFSIPLLHDPRVTGPLSFTVGLSGVTPPGQVYANNPATVTINDADPGFAFTNANFYTVKSGTNVVISVVRSNANTGLVFVNFATSDNTATAGLDYVSTNGVLTFSNGIALQSFNVPIINNRVVEGDRNFYVYLANPSPPAQLVNPNVASVTITDDLSGLSFSAPSYIVNENGVSATITVRRTGFTNSTVAINYATADGTGQAGANYVPASGTLTFTNGETTKTFNVGIIDDSTVNGDKTVLLSLSSPVGNVVLLNPNAAVLTIIETDGSLVVPAGTALTSESGPVNGGIDPGETVSMLFAFRNAAGTNTANLVATLLATNGITSPSSPQNYGALLVHGPSISKSFSFTANATNGQLISATFLLVDGLETNRAAVNFVVGQATTTYSNLSLITINDNTNASPYPSTINVSSLPGVVSKATVTLSNLSHTWPSDIDSILVSPSGRATHLLTKCGSSIAVNNVTLTFDDTASTIPNGIQLFPGTYHPTCYAPSSPPFPVPAPPPPYQTNLSTFNLSNPNGVWSLYVLDDRNLNTGMISNGWILRLTTSSQITGNADLGLGMTASPNPVVIASNLTYSFTLTNYGPAGASNIVVTDVLPPGSTYVSSTPSQGTASTNAGVLTWSIPAMAVNGSATLSLVIRPGVTGSLTNTAVVVNAVTDLNPDNDTGSAVVTVAAPTADLSLGMIGQPDPVVSGNFVTYTLSVTNLGPATASTISLTNTLPAGVTFISANPAGYILNGSTVAYANLGNLGNGSHLSATIVVRPDVGGTITNVATVASAIADPSKLNNNASVKVVVEPVVMTAVRNGSNLVVAWTTDASNYSLQSATSLVPPIVWTPVTNAPVIIGNQRVVTLPIGPGTTYFRLNGQSQ
jgi:uncharacterized delta-60 repeat protein/uncharacterized repeat protein (TIGR01451 family)